MSTDKSATGRREMFAETAQAVPEAVGLLVIASGDRTRREVPLAAGECLIGTYDFLQVDVMRLWQVSNLVEGASAYTQLAVERKDGVGMQERFPKYIRRIEVQGDLKLEFYSLKDEAPTLCAERQELAARSIVVTPISVHADGEWVSTRDVDDRWRDRRGRVFSNWSIAAAGRQG